MKIEKIFCDLCGSSASSEKMTTGMLDFHKRPDAPVPNCVLVGTCCITCARELHLRFEIAVGELKVKHQQRLEQIIAIQEL